MATYTAFASGTAPITSGTWTNPTYATGTNNAAFAALTLAAKSGTGYTILTYAAPGIDPAATISTVTANVWAYVSNTTYIASATAQLLDAGGAAIGAAVALTRSTTTTTSQSVTFPTMPTAAQVNAGLLVKLTATHASNSTTSATFNVDAASLTITYTVPLTLPYTETFTGANGSAWSSAWGSIVGGGNGAATIQNNAGSLTSGTSAYAIARMDMTAMPVIGDTDVTGTWNMTSTGGVEQYTAVAIDGDQGGGSDTPNNSYALTASYIDQAVKIRVTTGGTNSTVVTFPRTLTGNNVYGFRLQRLGQVINARVWDVTAGESEPSTWTMTYTVTGTPFTGVVSLASDNGADAISRETVFDNIVVSVPSSVPAYSASVALGGSGTLTSSASLNTSGTVALSGSGGLSGSGQVAALAYTGTATLSGSGGLSTATPVPHGPTGSWNLAFNDEFNGTTLDTNVWDPAEGYSVNNTTTTAANISVANGSVALNLASSTSGAEIFTKNAIFAVGDYVEFRALFPGDGTWLYNWPALWTSGPNWPTAGEIDFAEVLGGADGTTSNDMTVNYHYGTTVNVDNANNYPKPPGVGYLGDAYHIYGVHRKPTSFDVYYDSVKVMADVPTNDNGGAQNIIANMGTHISTGPNQVGKALLVDYVRMFSPATTAPSGTASVSFSGTGSLTSAATPRTSRSVAVSGSGTLTTSVKPATNATVALSGTGTLSSTATATQSSSAAINVTGSGTLTTTAAVVTAMSTAFSGGGSLGTVVTPGTTTVVLLSGTGGLGTAGGPNVSSTVALSGSGALSPAVRPNTNAAVATSGGGALTAVGTPAVPRTTALTGVGSLGTGSALANFTSTVALNGGGALSSSDRAGATAAVPLSGGGSLTDLTKIGTTGPTTFTGSGALSPVTSNGKIAAVALSGGSTLIIGSALTVNPTITITGAGTLSTDTRLAAANTVAVTGDGYLNANTLAALIQSPVFTGDGTLEGGGGTGMDTSSLLSGAGTLGAVGYATRTALELRNQQILKAYYGTIPVHRIYSNGAFVALG